MGLSLSKDLTDSEKVIKDNKLMPVQLLYIIENFMGSTQPYGNLFSKTCSKCYECYPTLTVHKSKELLQYFKVNKELKISNMIVCVLGNTAHYKLGGKELKLKFTNKEHIRRLEAAIQLWR